MADTPTSTKKHKIKIFQLDKNDGRMQDIVNAFLDTIAFDNVITLWATETRIIIHYADEIIVQP